MALLLTHGPYLPTASLNSWSLESHLWHSFPKPVPWACSLLFQSYRDHLPRVSYNLEDWLQLFQDLSQVPATLWWLYLLSQVWQKLSPFCFKFPFYPFLFWGLSKSHSRIAKDNFHGSTNPTLKEKQCAAVQLHVGNATTLSSLQRWPALWVKEISVGMHLDTTHIAKKLFHNCLEIFQHQQRKLYINNLYPQYIFIISMGVTKIADSFKTIRESSECTKFNN